MISLIVLFTFISIFLMASAVLVLATNGRALIKSRLESIIGDESAGIEDEQLSKPLYDRIIQPILKNLTGWVLKITPRQVLANYEELIVSAGTPYGFGANKWLVIQVLLIISIASTALLMGIVFRSGLQLSLLTAAAGIILGFLAPRMILLSKAKRRKKEIIKSLPNILDFMTVSVEAGLGFDAALGVVVEKMQGVLGSEFERALQEIKMGKPRKEALKNMSSRIDIVDFTTFIASIIQAEQLGVSIGNVLRVQSQEIRLKRRQRIQEKAMKAPVKMLIPMVLFIFPTIYTVILGPMIIRLLDVFKK